MDIGINLATAADSWRVVKRAEELGFAYAWFYDTQMLNADVFVAMAAAAMRTSRIRLGTGVLIPSNRIAPVAANALASLNALAPGRIHCGISTGFTARRAMGLGPIKQADMEEYIRVVQGLLRRETVTWEHEGQTRKIRFLNPELNLINTDDPVPLHISALGPRGRKLVARLGAGWMFTVRDVARSAAALADMQAAWRAAGRPDGGLYSTGIASG
jgi:5,10-methylenetetrahydromethanopterin reductase